MCYGVVTQNMLVSFSLTYEETLVVAHGCLDSASRNYVNASELWNYERSGHTNNYIYACYGPSWSRCTKLEHSWTYRGFSPAPQVAETPILCFLSWRHDSVSLNSQEQHKFTIKFLGLWTRSTLKITLSTIRSSRSSDTLSPNYVLQSFLT